MQLIPESVVPGRLKFMHRLRCALVRILLILPPSGRCENQSRIGFSIPSAFIRGESPLMMAAGKTGARFIISLSFGMTL